MTKLIRTIGIVALLLTCLFCCIGYAELTSNLQIRGTVSSNPDLPDIYITDVSPSESAGVKIIATSGTIVTAKVTGAGTARFTVTVKNTSEKIYVYERTVDGKEAGIDGVYQGTEIKYKVSNIASLDEILANGGIRSFQVEIIVPAGVATDQYVLNFKFIEKQGTEILPGNDEYDVTFKYNNGQPDVAITIHANEFIPRPQIPEKAGYSFIGWYKDEALTTVWNFDMDRVQNNMVLYAGWEAVSMPDPEPVKYSVTFRPNNGDASVTIQVADGSLLALPTSPVMEGHTFIGWYLDEACTDPWNFDTDKVSSNITLYGDWEEYAEPVNPELYITFRPNNGESDTTVVVLTGEFITRPPTPVKEGFVFIGWYTDVACTTAWNFEVDRPVGDMMLYGGWEEYIAPKPNEYVVTLQPNNGSTSTTVVVEEGSLIPPPTIPERDGYLFIGWYTDVECSESWNFDIDKPVSDMTLYGGWKKIESSGDNSEFHSDFLGLVEALLSNKTNCLNNSNVIYNALMESLESKKRPDEDAPIVHCQVNSISGGTMSDVATTANKNLSTTLHFIFEADPDPVYTSRRMRIYMYYKQDIDDANLGDEILVYKQIVSRKDGVWYADGTYIGTAIVGEYFGGGNSGKDVKTINPYSWKATTATIEE